MEIICQNCGIENEVSDGTSLANKVCTNCGTFGTLTEKEE